MRKGGKVEMGKRISDSVNEERDKRRKGRKRCHEGKKKTRIKVAGGSICDTRNMKEEQGEVRGEIEGKREGKGR